MRENEESAHPSPQHAEGKAWRNPQGLPWREVTGEYPTSSFSSRRLTTEGSSQPDQPRRSLTPPLPAPETLLLCTLQYISFISSYQPFPGGYSLNVLHWCRYESQSEDPFLRFSLCFSKCPSHHISFCSRRKLVSRYVSNPG